MPDCLKQKFLIIRLFIKNRRTIYFFLSFFLLLFSLQSSKFLFQNFIKNIPVAEAAGGTCPTGIKWDGGGSDEYWSNAQNWDGDVIPEINDVAIFDNTSIKNSTIDTNISIKGLCIESNYTGIITQLNRTIVTIGSNGFVQNGGTYTTPTTNYDISTNLEGYWRFNENSGTTALDSSTNLRPGTYSGTGISSGINGNARLFNGYSDSVQFSNTSDIPTQQFTVSAWVNASVLSANGENTIISKNYQSQSTVPFYLVHTTRGVFGDGRNGFGIGLYSGAWIGVATGEAVELNTWYHVTGSFDGNTFKIYVNGELKQSRNYTINVPINTSNISIGMYNPNYTFYWQGAIDEVQVFSRTLTDEEVTNLYTGNTTMYIDGDLNLTDGTFNAPNQLSIAGSLNSESDVFNNNNGTVYLTGINQYINSSITFHNLSKTTSTVDTLTLASGETQTITGKLMLKGNNSNFLLIRSSTPGSQANISPQGSKEIEYVDIRDINNTSTNPIPVQVDKLIDSGNNTGWVGLYNCLDGGDHLGNDWNPATDCPGGIAGIHTNIGTLNINSGQTVYVKDYNGSKYGIFSAEADHFEIQGTMTSLGKGYPQNAGPGVGPSYSVAGSHGGLGSGTSDINLIYGSTFTPITMGSGGRSWDGPGGAGGGAIALIGNSINIGSTALITSDGGGGGCFYGGWCGGNGAGGSVLIDVTDISGSGMISAKGGQAPGRVGGGGRIAVKYSGINSFTGIVSADTGDTLSEPGTAFIYNSNTKDLTIPSSNGQWFPDDFDYNINNFILNGDIKFASRNAEALILNSSGQTTIGENITITVIGSYTSLTDGKGVILNLNGDVTLPASSKIKGSSYGYAQQSGYGVSNYNSAGGSHGGYGGLNTTYVYGNAFDPTTLGHGGARNSDSLGGSGGSALKLTTSGTLTIEGSIKMNGGVGGCLYGSYCGGGGAGGSVSLITNTIAGDGIIEANGGSGQKHGYGGGGGRVSVKYSNYNYSGTMSSTGATPGGSPGTLILNDIDDNDIIIPQSQTWYADPALEGSIHNFRNFTINNSSTLQLIGYNTDNTDGVGFTFTGSNFTIESGSKIDADGGGYLGGLSSRNYLVNNLSFGGGPGGGGGNECAGYFIPGAGSYGGTGGRSSNETYGSLTAPTDLGSGGGSGHNGGSCYSGVAGGGAVKIVASDTLSIQGDITANGKNSSNLHSGAGSGGSIFLIGGTIESSVTSKLEVKGGDTVDIASGNGGGGRIALYYSVANNWQGSPITPENSATPGTWGQGGSLGTVFIGQSSIPSASSLRQYRADCTTQINAGGTTTQSTVCLAGTVNSANNPDNLTAQIEIQPLGTPFTNTPNFQSSPVPFTGSPVNFYVGVNDLNIGTSYHWQVRIFNELGVYSAWQSYGANSESSADFTYNQPTIQFESQTSSGLESTLSPQINLVLDSSSSSDITVGIAITGGTAYLNNDFTFSATEITIPANSISTSIPLTILEDYYVENNETIEFTITNPQTAILGNNSTHIYTITNNDTAGFNIATTSYSNIISENGSSDNYYISLKSKPRFNVVVQLSPNPQLTYSHSTLTFTPDNWDQYQGIIINAVNDDIAQGNRSTSINHSVSSSDTDYSGFALSSISFDIQDNDTVGINISGNQSPSIYENGSTTVLNYVLTSEPSDDVTVNFNTTSAEVNLDKSSLIFTSANWNTPQSITFTAVDDSIVQNTPRQAEIFQSVSSSDIDYNDFLLGLITISLIDDDTPGVILSASSIGVTEGGLAQSYSIRLETQPESSVTINLNPHSELAVNSNSLVFNSSNWNTPQFIDVTATHDFIAQGNRTREIQHEVLSSDTNYNNLSTESINVAITDIDVASVSVTQSGGYTSISEDGTTDSYEIVLTTSPSDSVTIDLTPDDSEININPSQIIFDSNNWNTPQIITVSIDNDFIATGNRNRIITHTISSSDLSYNNSTVNNLTVEVTDIDIAGFTVTETQGGTYTSESGQNDTLSIVLTSKPLFNVVINAEVNSQLLTSPQYALFTPENWNIPQEVTISAVNDLIAQGNRVTTLVLTPTSSDGNYENLSSKNINVSITDNDTAGIVITETYEITNVVKGSITDTYTIELTAEPQASVYVNIFTQSPLIADQAFIAFTPYNWSIPQTVTVSASDNQVFEETFTRKILHNASSTDITYDGMIGADLNVNVISNAVPGVNKTVGEIEENLNSSSPNIINRNYEIVLSAPPSENVTITINSPSDNITISPPTIIFTPINWNIPQEITIEIDTDDFSDELLTEITHTITTNDSNYNSQIIPPVVIRLIKDPVTTTTSSPSAVITSTTAPTIVVTNTISPTQNILTTNPTQDSTSTLSPSQIITLIPTKIVSTTNNSEPPSPLTGSTTPVINTGSTLPPSTPNTTPGDNQSTFITSIISPTSLSTQQTLSSTVYQVSPGIRNDEPNTNTEALKAKREIKQGNHNLLYNLIDEVGVVGVINIIMLLPYLIGLLLILLTFASSARFIFFQAGVKSLRIEDSVTHTGINFVRIILKNLETNKSLKRVSLFGGNTTLPLRKGKNIIEFRSSKYNTVTKEVTTRNDQSYLIGNIQMDLIDEKSFAYKFQLTMPELNIWFINSSAGSILSLINLIFNFNIITVTMALTFIIATIYTLKTNWYKRVAK